MHYMMDIGLLSSRNSHEKKNSIMIFSPCPLKDTKLHLRFENEGADVKCCVDVDVYEDNRYNQECNIKFDKSRD